MFDIAADSSNGAIMFSMMLVQASERRGERSSAMPWRLSILHLAVRCCAPDYDAEITPRP
jgi:hypothetical protein